MGVSTDAKLVYGFEIDEDSEDHERCDLLMDEEYDTLRKAENRVGAELVYHCSDECTKYIVGVHSTYIVAWRGQPVALNIDHFAKMNRGDLDGKLELIAKALGIKAKPGKWLLCSYCG